MWLCGCASHAYAPLLTTYDHTATKRERERERVVIYCVSACGCYRPQGNHNNHNMTPIEVRITRFVRYE